MFQVALILFALAAVSGLYLAVRHFQGQQLSVGSAVLHGIFAAAGLLVLIAGGVAGGLGGVVLYALILFVVAALGGFTLLFFHLRDGALPSPVVVIHALVAVIAFVLLLVGVLA